MVLAACVVVAVGAAAWYLWQQRATAGDLKFRGVITSDTCAPDYHQIPDIGCSIVVDGYSIEVEKGFSAVPFRGTVTGLDGNSLKGRQAEVFAHRLESSKSLDISTKTKYYVHIH